MASLDEKVISGLLLRRAPWDATDDEFAARIPFDSAAASADELKQQIASGESHAAQIHHDGQRVGLLVTRIETLRDGRREFVLVAAFADSTAPLTPQIASAAESLALAENCNSIRFHTVRAAAARLAAEAYGYRLAEVVMRKPLNTSPNA